MPKFDIVYVDASAFVDPAFRELARRHAGVRGARSFTESLRLPRVDVVRAFADPAALPPIERWLENQHRGDAFRHLTAKTADGIQAEIVRRFETVARNATPKSIAVLTADEAWADTLRRTYPGLPLLRLEPNGRLPSVWISTPTVRRAKAYEVSAPGYEPPPPAPVERAPQRALHPIRPIVDDATARREPFAKGTWFFAGGQHARLGRCLASGGEGWVHEVRFQGGEPGAPPMVCKVPRVPSAWRREKLEHQRACPAPPANVAWPAELAFDSRCAWFGFLVPRVEGIELQRVLQSAWREPHRAPSRRRLVRLAQGALAAIEAVHAIDADRRNMADPPRVLVGDIQPKNFLVGPDDAVTLIDADSVQLDGWPSPVGTVEYLHPELLGRQLRHTLRTIAHERFAVATLAFQILMVGQSPYAHVDGGSPAENQRKGLFPYRRESTGHRLVPAGPDGPYARMWSHLSPPVRAAFVASFEHREPPSIAAWLELLRDYDDALAAGRFADAAIPSTSASAFRAGLRMRAAVAC